MYSLVSIVSIDLSKTVASPDDVAVKVNVFMAPPSASAGMSTVTVTTVLS
ncbi:MAG TPA: hypothetical protein G4N95_07645 [Anaerolineae bacterium]|nr:hypothetical protein [Anaerolineae bacterium]